MGIDEVVVSRAIIEAYTKKLTDCLELEAAVVGGGPAGLMAAYKLASAGVKTALFERKLSVGGGMWGGGMMFNEIVIQDEAKALLDEVGVASVEFAPGYYTADAVACVACLLHSVVKAGARVFNLISVEDVMVREGRVVGLVINWTAVEMGGLHVDPLTVRSKYVIEATGHATEVVGVLARKQDVTLNTPSGRLEGERSMWAEKAEQTTVDNTREIYPGVYVAGMSANASFGSYRMGPIFGGMLLSGEKAASEIIQALGR
ncbi:MAG: thiazole biosynthesis protein [Deltaproteobacteria bacterium]|nr:thiazole biosynthesis protein [Deltaproteobacteria bacterium]